MKKVDVKQQEGAPEVPAVIIAQSVKKIAEAAEKMRQSGLNRRAIVALIQDECKLGKREIELVLNCLEELGNLYLTKKKS